jgi:signal peptidase I
VRVHLLLLVLGCAFATFGLRWALRPYTVASASMEPILRCGRGDGCSGVADRVIVDRLSYVVRAPHRNDLVAFRSTVAAHTCGESARAVLIKRIVGLPGEVVSEVRGTFLVDGRPLPEPHGAPVTHETGLWPRVAGDSYFVLGDDRGRSCDSRRWGPLPRNAILGRVALTYWPLDRFATH